MKYVMPAETSNCRSTSRMKLYLKPTGADMKSLRRLAARLVDLQVAQARRDDADAVGHSAAKLRGPHLHVAAADEVRQAVVDEDAPHFGQRARIFEEERIRQRADETVEAMVAGQHAKDPAVAIAIATVVAIAGGLVARIAYLRCFDRLQARDFLN